MSASIGGGAATTPRDALVLRSRRSVATGIEEFEFGRPDGSRLPDWAPGAHIDVVLRDGVVRQYSLCGDRLDAHAYRIAVQREPGGRGGSVTLHDELEVGDTVSFGGPRNSFRLPPAGAYHFIAGGIGITPILPMVRQAAELGADWRLVYLARRPDLMAYREELAPHGDRVVLHAADVVGRADLDAHRPTAPGVRVLACGPERLLDAVEAWGAVPGGIAPRVERFTARADDGRPSPRFRVRAERSAVTAEVGASESVVEALRRVGVDVLTSCAQGVCGTCETDVLGGEPDHRDSLLDDDERRSGRCMFPCVSRAFGPELVLDL